MANGQTVILHGDRQRAIAHQLVDRAPQSSVVNFQPPKRTNDQNAKWWAMLSDISRAKPDGRALPPESWKCLVMDDCGHKPIWIPSLDLNSVVCIGFKSSRLPKAKFSELIESTYAFGAEHGVEWSA